MNSKALYFFIASLIVVSGITAQKQNTKIKFGDVSAADFKPTVYSIDSSANAIVLADIGSSVFEGNSHGDFSLIFDHIKRIRILNKNAFDDASIEIPLYISGSNEELLQNFEASTYNIENGQVVVSKLDKGSLFKDKLDEHHTVRKFTFPNVKEGSIIEYKYRIISPYYFNLQPWDFQGSIPRLWSEYTTTIPSSIFDFVAFRQGYQPYSLDTAYTSSEQYNIADPGDAEHSTEVINLRSTTSTSHWIMENVPALKNESYVTTLDNYRSRIDFQLKQIRFSDFDVKDIMGNWFQLSDRMMKDENFGLSLNDNNGWLKDALKTVTAGTTTDLEKATRIYEYVRDNFSCNSDEGKYLTKSLKKTFQDKNGNVADINLLLTAALKNEGYTAQPAILSTRDNGISTTMYPIIDQYNYVVCKVNIGDTFYVLDATNKMFGFAKLPANLYNGYARIIDQVPALITLSADSINESKFTTVFISNNDDGKSIDASFSSQLGNQESYEIRKELSKKEQNEYFKKLKKNYSFDIDMSDQEIDSLQILDAPVTVKYDFKFDPGNDDLIYFNPMMGEGYKENPFKSEKRLYPVEMPSCSDEVYIFNMDVPKGYKVEELPKSARVLLNEDDGMFEYIIAGNNEHIQLRCRIQIKKANFEVNDYQTLRDFFTYIVNKQAEQIVFKKN